MNDDSAANTTHSVSDVSVKGAEVLLVDRDERVRDGFCKLLTSAGAMVTAVEDERALELAQEKYFAVAVIDLDTPSPGGGIVLLEQLKQRSPNTEVVLMTARQTFDVASAGFRAGAADVIAKEPDRVKYLTEIVVNLCAKEVASDESKQLLAQTLQTLDQFLERLMAASRKAAAAEEQAGIDELDPDDVCHVLIVDDNPRNAPGLQRALDSSAYKVITALTGGEALDCAGSQRFQLALVKKELPDLPSSMVVTSLKAEVPESIVLLFSPPTDETPGRVDIIEGSKTIEMIPSLERGEQLVGCIHELRQAYRAKLRERRYLRIFREEHYDFLRRYVELKQRLGNLLESDR